MDPPPTPHMKDRSDDLSYHERTLLPRSYISLPFNKVFNHKRHEMKIDTSNQKYHTIICYDDDDCDDDDDDDDDGSGGFLWKEYKNYAN